MHTVGIIGGLGPETTAEFYTDLVFSCYEKDQSRRPSILISSVPLPYEIEQDLIQGGTGEERYIPFLQAEAKRLEQAGADFLVIPCNSVHIFIDEVRDAVTIPVLSIVEATTAFLQEGGHKKVGVVSTSATLKNKLYETALSKAGIQTIVPDDLQQAKMGKIISNLVLGKQQNADRDTIVTIVYEFAEKDVDCVILACTDLQLLIPQHPTLKVVDTMKILVDATVERILEKG